MTLRQSFTALLLLIAMLPGCTSLVQAPRVDLQKAHVVGLDTSGVDIELHLGIANPNPFDLSLLSYTFDLQVLTLPLSSGGMEISVLFPAGEETEMILPVHVKLADLLEIARHAPDTGHIPYHLNSLLNLKTPLGNMAVPVEKSAVLDIPDQYRHAAYINRLRDILRGFR